MLYSTGAICVYSEGIAMVKKFKGFLMPYHTLSPDTTFLCLAGYLSIFDLLPVDKFFFFFTFVKKKNLYSIIPVILCIACSYYTV